MEKDKNRKDENIGGDAELQFKKARIAEANKAGIAEAKEARITKGEIQTKEARLAQAKLKWRAELPNHLAMAAHVKKEMFEGEDEEDLVSGLYTECGFDMHATYARLFFYKTKLDDGMPYTKT